MFDWMTQDASNIDLEARRTPYDPNAESGPGFFDGSLTGLYKGAEEGGLELRGLKHKLNLAESPEERRSHLDSINKALKELQPDPHVTGYLGQITQGFGKIISQATLGTVMAGGNPLGGAVLTTLAQTSAAEERLKEEGVSPEAARHIAPVMGAMEGLGVMAPAAGGAKLISKLLSGVGINVGLGGAQRGLEGETLRRYGYDDMADQYKVLDGSAILTDAVLGAAFGALHKGEPVPHEIAPSDIDTALVANNLQNLEIESAPGIPTDTATRNSHVEAMRLGSEQLLNDERVNVGEVYKEANFVPKGDMHTPPKEISSYRDVAEYRKKLRSTYVDEKDNIIASSREVPQSESAIPPVGTWFIEPVNGLHGREVGQVRRIPISELTTGELDRDGKLDPVKRGDEERYAQWINEGKKAPPIEVVETDKGQLKITDGHRRYLAAKAAGKDYIEAIVWPMMDHPEGLNDSQGQKMRVGMTFEKGTKKNIGEGPEQILKKEGYPNTEVSELSPERESAFQPSQDVPFKAPSEQVLLQDQQLRLQQIEQQVLLEKPDMVISTEDGDMTVAEALAKANEDTMNAEKDASLFQAAITCFLRNSS